MKYIYLILNWGFGVLIGLMGLVSLVISPLGGFCLITISALLLPTVRNAVYSKTNKELPVMARAISIFVLFFAFGIFVVQSQDEKANELAAQKVEQVAKARQENIDYFNNNREQIISSVSAALSEKNYSSVISQSSKYLAVKDDELDGMRAQAKKVLHEIIRAEREAEREAEKKAQREAKTNEILATLKTVPTSEFKENKDLYQQLVTLDPYNSNYQEKLEEFSQKLNAQIKAKEKAQREAKKKEILATLKTVPASEFKENKDLYQQLVTLAPDNSNYQEKLEDFSQKLNAQIKAKEKAQREAKKKEILATLKTVPASEFKENKDLYQQLVTLAPDNSKYQKKLEHYSQKLDAQMEKERVRAAIFGKPPKKNGWNGTYFAVKYYLERVANDPDSIKIDSCTEVYQTKNGWLVGCDYRGKNAYGGMIRQSNWFTIIQDQVIQMHKASAYSF